MHRFEQATKKPTATKTKLHELAVELGRRYGENDVGSHAHDPSQNDNSAALINGLWQRDFNRLHAHGRAGGYQVSGHLGAAITIFNQLSSISTTST
jgi:hypothetical protein